MYKICHGSLADTLPVAVERAGAPRLITAVPPTNIGQPYAPNERYIHISHFERYMMEWMEPAYNALAVGGVLAVYCCDDRVTDEVLDIARSWGWRRVGWLVIAGHPGGRDTRQAHHDTLLLYTNTKQETTHNGADTATVWYTRTPAFGEDVTCPAAASLPHVTEATAMKLISTYSNEGDVVLDLLGGGGTVPTVAHYLNRRVITIEPSAAACAAIKQRIDEGPATL